MESVRARPPCATRLASCRGWPKRARHREARLGGHRCLLLPDAGSCPRNPGNSIAKKRERKSARRAARRNDVIARQHPRVHCLLCDSDCAHDGVPHADPDCGHGYVVCPVCAVQSCDDCVSRLEIIEMARRRDPDVAIRIDPVLVKRLATPAVRADPAGASPGASASFAKSRRPRRGEPHRARKGGGAHS